ncbi:MAG: hypothetical protein QQW96_00835 [Tychonema bourrellyi B0820]|uniref:hypothetical protein n=1 Tax=Tychonema bourrellyi TaxID=54313 RepID=UPI0015D4EFA9|nr:hypothetical protein [Tychonema bourrellyi]MDQ2096183.1 hypothetical protein [Tychonema bourrellyi B0820]
MWKRLLKQLGIAEYGVSNGQDARSTRGFMCNWQDARSTRGFMWNGHLARSTRGFMCNGHLARSTRGFMWNGHLARCETLNANNRRCDRQIIYSAS